MNGADQGASLQLDAELNIYSAAATRDALLAAMRGSATLVLDLSQVCEIDSAGVQLLLAARRQPGCALELRHHTSAVSEALALFGLDHQLAPL